MSDETTKTDLAAELDDLGDDIPQVDDSFLDEPAEGADPDPVVEETPEEEESNEEELEEGEEEGDEDDYEPSNEPPEMVYLRQENERLLNERQQLLNSVAPQHLRQAQQQQLQVLPFVEDEEAFEQAISSPAQLNRVLSRVHYTALQEAARAMQVNINQQVAQQVRAATIYNDFMSKNPEFESPVAQRALAAEIQQVYQQNPNADMRSVMEQAGRNVKQLAKGNKTVKKDGKLEKPKSGKKQKPAFAGKPAARPPAGKPDKRTELQRELDAL